MKNLLFTLTLLFIASLTYGQTWVDGYVKSDGTYVNGYYKTSPNGTNVDNYSTQGNVNPFTNSSGTKPRDYSRESSNYSSGKTLYVGPRGGVYYINSNGNKVYVPK